MGVFLPLSALASATRDIFDAARALVCPLIPLWPPFSLRVPKALLDMPALIASSSPLVLKPVLARALRSLCAAQTLSMVVLPSVATLQPLACESWIFVNGVMSPIVSTKLLETLSTKMEFFFSIKTLFCLGFILLRPFNNFPFNFYSVFIVDFKYY